MAQLDRSSLLARYADAPRRLEEEVRALPVAALAFRPNPDDWTATELDPGPKRETGPDRRLELLREPAAGSAIGHLDLDRDRWLGADGPLVTDDARAPGHSRPEVADHREDRRRVDVDAADDEHVVAPPGAAPPEAGAPASAGGALDADNVPAEEADDRHRLAREVRVDDLTHGAGLDG